MGYGPCDGKESDTTEYLSLTHSETRVTQGALAFELSLGGVGDWGMGDAGVAAGLVCRFRDSWPILLVL